MKPIEQAFRKAGKLFCTHIDSYLYGSFVTSVTAWVVSAGIWNTQTGLLRFVDVVGGFMGTREAWRCIGLGKQMFHEDDAVKGEPISSAASRVGASGFVAGVAYTAAYFAVSQLPSIPAESLSVGPVCGGVLLMAASHLSLGFGGVKLRDIPKIYFDKEHGLWDLPSRKPAGKAPSHKDTLNL